MSVVTGALLTAAMLAPVFVLVLALHDQATRRRLLRRLGDLPVLGRVLATASPFRRYLKDLLLAIALGLVFFALARPQIGGKRRVEVRGLDLVVAVDVSKSMLVDDVDATLDMVKRRIPTSRLARARELATAVIEELPGDRIAPVVFAGAASHFPLTEDHQVAVRSLSDLGPADLPPGSNLGEVFRVSRCLLRPDLYEDLGCERIGRRGRGGDPLPGERDADLEVEEEVLDEQVERGKAILLLTDGGEANAEVLQEVAMARELGVAVFIVGVGTTAGGTVYEIDSSTGKRGSQAKLDASGKPVHSRRDDAAMTAIAAAGGDQKRFMIAPERGEVDPMPIVEALRAVNRGLATKQVKERKDVFQPFLFAAFMLLVVEAAIGTRRRRQYPEAR